MTALVYPWADRQRIDDEQGAKIGLTIEEHKQRRQSAPDPLTPTLPLKVGRGDCRGELRDRAIEEREKTIFAAVKELIEREARNTRAARHEPHKPRGIPLPRKHIHSRV